MTEDNEPINPILHAHLIGLGYRHALVEGYTGGHAHYYWEVETDHGVTCTGLMVDVYRDGSIRIGGKTDSHTGDLLRFLAIALGEGK